MPNPLTPDDRLALAQQLRDDVDRLTPVLFHVAVVAEVLPEAKASAAIAAAAQLALATAEAVPWYAPRLAEAFVAAAQALRPTLVVVDLARHDGPTH